jgi:hypothetical protein
VEERPPLGGRRGSGVQAVEAEEVVLDGQDVDAGVAGVAGELADGVGAW